MTTAMKLTTFRFLRPAHFDGGRQVVDTVCECCEGLFGVQQFRSACRLHICSPRLGFGFNTDTIEGKVMARILRHVLREHLRGEIWAEDSVTIDAATGDQIEEPPT